MFGDDWGRYPSTMQHVFRHIAPRFPVLWINGIGHRVPSLNLKDIKRGWEKVLRTAAKGAVAPAAAVANLGGRDPALIIEPRVLPWHHWSPVFRYNTHSLLGSIRQGLSTLGLSRPPVLVTGSPPSVGVLGQLGERASIYFVLDDFLNFPTYTASMLAPLERQLLDRVDLVVATAASLTRSKFPRSGRAEHLPQGVNYDHFASPRPIPADLAAIAGPRIGFAGSVSTQCDVELIVRLAESFPDAAVVLVGPIGLDEQGVQPLQRPNIHLLGVRPYVDLPGYVQHFDVGIIPYVISPWTVAVDPLKLLEYLAAGLPVVTTAIPEAAKYAAEVTIAGEHPGFIEGVRRALAGDRNAQRARGQAFARLHTWEQRADRFLAFTESVLDTRMERQS